MLQLLTEAPTVAILRKEDPRCGPTDVSGMLDFVVNPGDHLECLVFDQVGTSIGTALPNEKLAQAPGP